MFRLLVILTILLFTPVLSAQADAFDGQITAIEQLIKKKRFEVARAQARALIESGIEAGLTEVEAVGRLLEGRTILEDPGNSAKDRLQGIHQLRKAALVFRKENNRERVTEIVALLTELTGDGSIDLKQHPSVQSSGRTFIPTEDSLTEISLEAIDGPERQPAAADRFTRASANCVGCQ